MTKKKLPFDSVNTVSEIVDAAEASKPEFLAVEEEPVNTLSPLVKRVNALAKKAQQREGKHHLVEMKQLDLFVADLLDYNLKDDTATMEAPLFSLSTKPDMDTWRWESPDKKKWLEVTPSSIGRATIHDKDLLIYITSQLAAAMNVAARNGTKMPGRRVRFTLHDYLIATGRDTAGKAYASVESTLDRLSGTRLKTNIEMGNIDRRSSFGLIERSDYILQTDSKGNKRMSSIEITLSEWLYRALEQKNILTITPNYFKLRKPLEKRLYELARKHVGEQADWVIRESILLDKTGSKANIREFRRMLEAIIEDDSIPDYRMNRYKSDSSSENMVKFYQKNAKKLALAYAKKNAGKGNQEKPDVDLLG
ncbi:replication initiator protein A [Undibacterium sp. TS12]|uniref:replication initiator protein A n=1 Tax=Undibacterium sp. TS12 TaxID=2908202 RepID=UPI001F4C7845|nr:replication initiator protein A [Undibacterium sp. TS12]MCH8622949.1 replication initiator protein A [Undibacterium sp. TS12]